MQEGEGEGEGDNEGFQEVIRPLSPSLHPPPAVLEQDCDHHTRRRVIRRILQRLPVKTLLRFRCVCRRWNRLISSHSFAYDTTTFLRPVSGLFYHTTEDVPDYAPFRHATDSLPDSSLSFLPEPVTVKASSRGLLCCQGHPSLQYYVCNPATAVWAGLPPPPAAHGPDSAVVLVFDDRTRKSNSTVDFWVVCAYPVDVTDFREAYGFQKFSTAAWGWATSNHIVAQERLVPGSGVEADGFAMWRTTEQKIIGYGPHGDLLSMHKKMDFVVIVWWELGEMEGNLCLTDVCAASTLQKSAIVAVQSWVNHGRWRPSGCFGFWPGLGENKLRPLRTQGEGELLFWDGYRQVFGRDMDGRTTRLLVINAADCRGDFLPYVSTLMKVKRHLL